MKLFACLGGWHKSVEKNIWCSRLPNFASASTRSEESPIQCVKTLTKSMVQEMLGVPEKIWYMCTCVCLVCMYRCV